jgi:predicted aspartyl protease
METEKEERAARKEARTPVAVLAAIAKNAKMNDLASLFSPMTKAQVEAAKKYQLPMFPGTAHPMTPAAIPSVRYSIGQLGACITVKRHDDGDLTIKCRGKAYVQTTEGRTFQEIKLNDKWDGKKEPMTQSDAVVEAGRRWKSGAIETFKSGKKRVGYVQMNFFNVMGEGTTWEEAFAEADKKAESDKRWSKEIEEGRKKSKLTEALPVCTATEAKKLERCILSVKKKGTAVSPFAVCQVSVGCKKPKTKLNEVSPEVAAAIATPKTVKLNDMFQVDLEVANPVVPGWEKMPAWVDTGGSLSIIPIKTAEKLQLQQLKNHPRENVYDARGMLKRPVFLAHIKVSGMETPDIVWGMPLEVATIGAHTLEVLGLKVDPVNKKLEKVIQNSYGGQVSFEDVSLNENEKGYCVCKDGDTLLKEKVVSGEAHSITIPVSCSTGKVAALVHLHPSGNIEASRQDLETSKRLGVPVCVVVSGQKVKCYQAVKG